MSHDQKRPSDWTRQDPVAEQLAVRDFTRPSFSQRLKGVACETKHGGGALLKTELTQPTVLALYDPAARSKVSADALSFGLEAVSLCTEKQHRWMETCNLRSAFPFRD